MHFDRVFFDLPGTMDAYVLMRRGQEPFDPHGRLERVEPFSAPRYVLQAVRACWQHPRWELLHFFDIYENPVSLDEAEAVAWVEHRLHRHDAPELYRQRWSINGVSPPRLPRVPPPKPPPAPAVRPRSFVFVEIVSTAGDPLPGVHLEVTAPDGSVSTLVSDLYGRAGLDGIDPGTCSIVLPKVDRSAWMADGSPGQPVSTGAGKPHVVQRGECLSQLAHAHGIADWLKLWDHPDNASLKTKRKSPHVLLPGDQVFIPGLEQGKIERATDAIHRIVVASQAAEVELVLVLRDHEGNAMQAEPYELSYRHQGKLEKKTGQLSGSGELRELFPASVRSADLRLTALDLRRRLAIGHLDPALDEQSQPLSTGVRTRLSALGFASRKSSSGPHADLRAAVRLFQQQVMGMSDPTGALDEATCAKLEEAYGV